MGICVARNVFFLFIWVVPVGNTSPSIFYIKFCCVDSIFCVTGVGSSLQSFMWRGKINALIQKFKLDHVKEILKYERRANKRQEREQIVGKGGGRKVYKM